jgi:hypothetical protein
LIIAEEILRFAILRQPFAAEGFSLDTGLSYGLQEALSDAPDELDQLDPAFALAQTGSAG